MDKIFQQDLTKEEKVDGIFIVKLNLMVNHAYNTALYLLINDSTKQSSVYSPALVFKINNGLSSPH